MPNLGPFELLLFFVAVVVVIGMVGLVI